MDLIKSARAAVNKLLGNSLTRPRRPYALRPFQDTGSLGINRYYTKEDILKAPQYSTYIWACLNERASSLAKLKIRALSPDGDEIFGPMSGRSKRQHPLYKLIQRPNPIQYWFDFIWLVNAYADLGGNCLIWMDGVNMGSGQPQALWPLDPTRCEPSYDDMGVFNGYKYRLADDSKTFLPARFVAHVKRPNPQNHYWGNGIAETVVADINVSTALREYVSQYFNQGTQTSGILTTPVSLDDDNFERLRTEIQATLAGQRNAHKVAVLDSDLTFQPTTPNIGEVKVAELEKITLTKIFMAFSVPPGRMGLTDFSNWSVDDLDKVWMGTVETLALQTIGALNTIAALYTPEGGAIPDDEREAVLTGAIWMGETTGCELEFIIPDADSLMDKVAAFEKVDSSANLTIVEKRRFANQVMGEYFRPNGDDDIWDDEPIESSLLTELRKSPTTPAKRLNAGATSPAPDATPTTDAKPAPAPEAKEQAVSLTPPKAVISAMRSGLAMRRMFGRGGTQIAANIANSALMGGGISRDELYNMMRYFPQKAAAPANKMEEPSSAFIAYMLLGGDAGLAWAKEVWPKVRDAR